MMKKIIAVILITMLLAGCSSENDRTNGSSSKEISSSKPTEQGVFSAEDVVKQYRKAINQDDVALAQSFIGENVTVGILDSDGATNMDNVTVYTKEQMDKTIENYSKTQQEYIKDEYLEGDDYSAIVEGYEPNYITSMVWNLGREDYKIRTKYVVKNDYITEIYIMSNPELTAERQKKTAGIVGLDCEIIENEIYVKSAAEGMPAYRAGFIPKDKIISIGDMLVEDMRLDIDEHLYRLRGEIDSTVDVVVERGGKNHDYVLKRVSE